MKLITGAQVRMARSLLKWSQDELAEKAGVSRGTIRTYEDDVPVRESIIQDIHSVFDAHGVEFAPDGSVRPRTDSVKDFCGIGGCDRFFENIERMIAADPTEVVCMIATQNMLTKTTGTTGLTNFERLEQLSRSVTVKCWLQDQNIYLPASPSFEVRVLPYPPSSIAASQFIYANECTMAVEHGNMFNRHPAYMVIKSSHHAKKAFEYFSSNWIAALPYKSVASSKRVAVA